jgi:hypothetical protein
METKRSALTACLRRGTICSVPQTLSTPPRWRRRSIVRHVLVGRGMEDDLRAYPPDGRRRDRFTIDETIRDDRFRARA